MPVVSDADVIIHLSKLRKLSLLRLLYSEIAIPRYVETEISGKVDEDIKRLEEEKALITFLKRTKEGKYAKIDETLMDSARVKEQREPYYNEEEYYYGIR